MTVDHRNIRAAVGDYRGRRGTKTYFLLLLTFLCNPVTPSTALVARKTGAAPGLSSSMVNVVVFKKTRRVAWTLSPTLLAVWKIVFLQF